MLVNTYSNIEFLSIYLQVLNEVSTPRFHVLESNG